ncbi:MAG: hypothetical protein K2X37_13445 [Chitinophagaceae bacterium]|nr:hypothetical protein [Chitinophagaceae bacterium]
MIKKLLPVFIVSAFVMVFAILVMAKVFLPIVDGRVVLVANLLLTGILIWNIWRSYKANSDKNPHAMVRGVMSGVVLKLFVLGGAAFIYLYAAGVSRNTNALFISMGLYIIYTWLEVRIITSQKK